MRVVVALTGFALFLSWTGSHARADDVALDDSEAPSRAVALEAQTVVNEYCADVAAGETALAAQSLAEVSAVWGRVSEELDKGRKVYLLYWRGVLAQCLSQEQRASEDLEEFIRVREGSSLWAGLVADAKRRLRRLHPGDSAAKPLVRPGTVVGASLGVSLIGASVGTGVGAAVKWLEVQAHAETMYPRKLTGHALADEVNAGNAIARVSYVLMGVSGGCGLVGLISIVATAATGKPSRRAQLQPPLLVPSPEGLGLVWEGTW